MATQNPNWTAHQKSLYKSLTSAVDIIVDYAAPEVPELGNLTPNGLVDQAGALNSARKSAEKVENILKERMKSQLNGIKKLRGDKYEVTIGTSERTALDQQKCKETLATLGRVNVDELMNWIMANQTSLPSECFLDPADTQTVLDKHMPTTEVDRTTFKELGL